MTLNAILARLTPLWPRLEEEYAVARLAVFGSHARGTQKEKSDVDLLVNFSKKLNEEKTAVLKRELEAVLGKRVDLNEWQRVYDTERIGFYVIADRVDVPRTWSPVRWPYRVTDR